MRRRPVLPPLPAIALLVFALVAADAAVARAGGFHISVLGVRRTGMLTNLGNPDDVTALFHNPAGLADLDGFQLQLSSGITSLDSNTALQVLDPVRFPEVDSNQWPTQNDCMYQQGKTFQNCYYKANIKPTSYVGITPYLGISQNLGRFSPKLDKLTLSAALYAPGAYGAALPTDAPSAYFVTNGLFVIGAATVGVGWRPHPIISIGASFSYAYMRLGYGVKFSSIDTFTPNGQPPTNNAKAAQAAVGDFTLDFSGDDHGVGWGLGVLINPKPWIGIGLAYQGWTNPRFNGPLRLTPQNPSADLPALAKTIGYKLPKTLTVEMSVPPALSAGVNFKIGDTAELGIDLRYWLYRLYQKQNITPNYDASEPGTEAISAASLSKEKHYSDSWQLCVGALGRPIKRFRGFEIMGGVGFDKSPVPDETFSLDSPSLDQLFAGVGVRVLVKKRFRLGLTYEFTYSFTRDVRTSQASPPVNVRIDATNHMPTLGFEYLAN